MGPGAKRERGSGLAFGAPPGAQCSQCGLTEDNGTILIAQKGGAYLCLAHHNANRSRRGVFADYAFSLRRDTPLPSNENNRVTLAASRVRARAK